jgi:hypothetical protein
MGNSPGVEIIVPVKHESVYSQETAERLQVTIHVQASVLAPQIARRKVNVWLLANAGNLLGAENPQLILGERLFWRFNVVRSLPRLDSPGMAVSHTIGQMDIDAITGEPVIPDNFIKQLQSNADADACGEIAQPSGRSINPRLY